MARKDPAYVVLGASDKSDKAVIANKSERVSGYEVHICQLDKWVEPGTSGFASNDISGEYMTLYFCKKERLRIFINTLQDALEKWEGNDDVSIKGRNNDTG